MELQRISQSKNGAMGLEFKPDRSNALFERSNAAAQTHSTAQAQQLKHTFQKLKRSSSNAPFKRLVESSCWLED